MASASPSATPCGSPSESPAASAAEPAAESPAASPASPLATLAATRAVLRRHGFNLKKSLGQNFLVSDAIVGKIVALADVTRDDVVLEVGPGIGTLTCALLERARGVVAIERDPALPAVLADTLAPFAGRFALVEKDALDAGAPDVARAADAIGCAAPNKLVANLPYAVAATVVLDYLGRFPGLSSMTVMVQREVAERMMAGPNTKVYGAYTVKLALQARPCGWFSVGPGNFMPPPRVESAVLRLERRDAGMPADALRAACTMADAAFFARRKTIANSCKQYFQGRSCATIEALPAIFADAGVDPGIRGEALAPDVFAALGRAYAERFPKP